MPESDELHRRIAEAQVLLAALGMPPDQQKQVPALTLLALCGLKPDTPWSEASNPNIGVSPIMDFANANYGVSYRENSRETFRKSAIHYFEAAQLIVKNPDNPERPTNSGKTVYQLTDTALALIRKYGTDAFAVDLPAYIESFGTLVDRYAARRTLKRVPLRLLTKQQVTLSEGSHSELIEKIIKAFGSRFTPNGILVYAGDTRQKWGSYFDEHTLRGLGVTVASSGGKMPDVLIHHEEKGWLVVVEAFDSVGPIDPLRRAQLEILFAASTIPVST